VKHHTSTRRPGRLITVFSAPTGLLARIAEPRLLDPDGRWPLGRVGKWMTVVKNAASAFAGVAFGVLVARRLGI
jgi:hypothetical protein